MYAVIRAGGKQYKVAKGDVIEIERLRDAESVEFTPLLLVDDDGKTRATKDDLAGVRVTAKVLGEAKGPKVEIMKYRSKSRYRRHTGHRQKYTTVQIEDIATTGKTTTGKTNTGKTTAGKTTTGKTTTGKAAPADETTAGKSTGKTTAGKTAPADETEQE